MKNSVLAPELVSIIVRTEGRRPALLRQALHSLDTQTYMPIEVLVVHDGGRAQFSLRDEIITSHVALHWLPIEKAGRSVAGNVGLRAAAGEYIGFLDDDDILKPNHVATLVDALHQNAGVDLVYAAALEMPVTAAGVALHKRSRTVLHKPFSPLRLLYGNIFPIQAALFRRKLYDRHGGFDEALDVLEDWDLWLRYAMQTPFAACEGLTSEYRVPADKTERMKRAAQHADGMDQIKRKHAGMNVLVNRDSLDEFIHDLRMNLDDHVGARWAAGRIWRRLLKAR
jgi:glycosyltransferase involved in cell wall biosynthesis